MVSHQETLSVAEEHLAVVGLVQLGDDLITVSLEVRDAGAVVEARSWLHHDDDPARATGEDLSDARKANAQAVLGHDR